jgi:very-short-patch-repair endonuclease
LFTARFERENMNKILNLRDVGVDEWPDQHVGPKRLPGLYPWLRFEKCTLEQWVECHGIDLEHVNERAANAYLSGEGAFFEKFEEDYASALGRQRANDLKQRTLEDTRAQFNHAAAKLCKSPIELVLLAPLVWARYGYDSGPVEIWDTTFTGDKPVTNVVIAPQYQIDRHSVDFAIFIRGVANEWIKIVVECDGHDFHERTKEQAARDKSRDRDLQIGGWKVLRFTGSEIWRDYSWCAAAVGELAAKEIAAQLLRRGIPHGK